MSSCHLSTERTEVGAHAHATQRVLHEGHASTGSLP